VWNVRVLVSQITFLFCSGPTVNNLPTYWSQWRIWIKSYQVSGRLWLTRILGYSLNYGYTARVLSRSQIIVTANFGFREKPIEFRSHQVKTDRTKWVLETTLEHFRQFIHFIFKCWYRRWAKIQKYYCPEVHNVFCLAVQFQGCEKLGGTSGHNDHYLFSNNNAFYTSHKRASKCGLCSKDSTCTVKWCKITFQS